MNNENSVILPVLILDNIDQASSLGQSQNIADSFNFSFLLLKTSNFGTLYGLDAFRSLRFLVSSADNTFFFYLNLLREFRDYEGKLISIVNIDKV